jgi:L-methionine (R)-S-oxide reductase
VNEGAVTAELAEAMAGEWAPEEFAARVAGTIRRFGRYRWVGLYHVGAEEIRLLGWGGPGPPANPRFPRSEGLCGAVVATGKAVTVGDVRSDSRYLTTHSSTRSELVVPILRNGLVVGLIDVESARLQAFGNTDRERLERCAATIAPRFPAQLSPAAHTRPDPLARKGST